MATLVVEDGTGVAGANSYVTLLEMRAYAADRSLIVPANDPAGDETLITLLIRATDYIESARHGPWKGDRTYTDPAVATLSWPRTGVYFDGMALASNQIPLNIKKAQMQLAFEIQTIDPSPTLAGQVVKREKVDVIETEYAIDYKAGQKPPVLTKVDLLLQPLLRSSGFLRVTRI